jgi:hypothetical protein
LSQPACLAKVDIEQNQRSEDDFDKGDPHLRSIAEVTGYYVHATDGDLGHVQDFLLHSTGWGVRYLIVDTSAWWFGRHVLISPGAVKTVDWSERHVRLDIDRARVKSSPPWNPEQTINDEYEHRSLQKESSQRGRPLEQLRRLDEEGRVVDDGLADV